MDDEKRAAQAAVPNQAAAEAQQMQIEKKDYSGGNALLDAQIQAGEQTGSPVDEPIATDIAGNDRTEDPQEAQNITTTGNYPIDRSQLDDEGNLSMVKDTPTAE